MQTQKSPANWALVADGSWMKGKSYEIEGTMVVGRSMEVDLTLPSTHLSRQHATLECKGDRLFVKDMGSANGTYVNGERVQTTEVKSGDQIRFDTFSFRIEGPAASDATVERKIADPSAGGVKRAPTKRSTSPGNRVEPPPPAHSRGLKILSAAIVVVVIAYILYLLLFTSG